MEPASVPPPSHFCCRPLVGNVPDYPGATKVACDSCGRECWQDDEKERLVLEALALPCFVCTDCALENRQPENWREKNADRINAFLRNVGFEPIA
jgi:hypothetical protein